MVVEKFSISLDPDLLAQVREAAEDDGETISAWMADAARRRLRTLALGQAVDAMLADAGITEKEALAALAEARKHAIHTTGEVPSNTRLARSKRKAANKRDAAPTKKSEHRATSKRATKTGSASRRKAG